jgi:hypothetical protein
MLNHGPGEEERRRGGRGRTRRTRRRALTESCSLISCYGFLSGSGEKRTSDRTSRPSDIDLMPATGRMMPPAMWSVQDDGYRLHGPGPSPAWTTLIMTPQTGHRTRCNGGNRDVVAPPSMAGSGRKQEARSRKQEAGNRKQETGNRKQETGRRKQEAGSGVLTLMRNPDPNPNPEPVVLPLGSCLLGRRSPPTDGADPFGPSHLEGHHVTSARVFGSFREGHEGEAWRGIARPATALPQHCQHCPALPALPSIASIVQHCLRKVRHVQDHHRRSAGRKPVDGKLVRASIMSSTPPSPIQSATSTYLLLLRQLVKRLPRPPPPPLLVDSGVCQHSFVTSSPSS